MAAGSCDASREARVSFGRAGTAHDVKDRGLAAEKNSSSRTRRIPAFGNHGLNGTRSRQWVEQVQAERLGRSSDECAALRKRIDPADPSETAYAIRCDLPVGRTETLLIVDQFEELLTEPDKHSAACSLIFSWRLSLQVASRSCSPCASIISICVGRFQACSSI